MRDKMKLVKCLYLRNNRFLSLVFVFILLLSSSTVYAQDSKENWQEPAKEFLGAVAGDVLIGIPSGLVTTFVFFGTHADLMDKGPGITFAAITYIAGGMIGAPLGTVYTGKKLHQSGSVLDAYLGGVVGTGLGILILSQTDSKIPATIAIPAFILLPPLCSVIGYNLFPHKNNSQSSIFSKNLPAIGLSVLPEKHVDKISPKIGANVTFRF